MFFTRAKVEAIEKIGFGRVGKVFLRFERPWWAKGEEGIKVLIIIKHVMLLHLLYVPAPAPSP